MRNYLVLTSLNVCPPHPSSRCEGHFFSQVDSLESLRIRSDSHKAELEFGWNSGPGGSSNFASICSAKPVLKPSIALHRSRGHRARGANRSGMTSEGYNLPTCSQFYLMNHQTVRRSKPPDPDHCRIKAILQTVSVVPAPEKDTPF